MADITEVIHRITYEVNDEGLKRIAMAINLQLTHLGKLNEELVRLQGELARTSGRQADVYNRIAKDIENITRKIEQNAGRAKGVLEQMGDGILKGLGGMGQLEEKTKDFVGELVKGLGGVDKFSGASMAKLGTSLLSVTSVAPLAISLIATVAEELIKSSNAADKAKKSYDEYQESLKKGVKDAKSAMVEQTEKFDLEVLGGKNDPDLARKLINKYPQLLGKYTPSQLMSGEADGALGSTRNAIQAAQRRDFFSQQAVALSQKIEEAKINKEATRNVYLQKQKEYQRLSSLAGSNPKLNVSAALRMMDNAKEKYDSAAEQVAIFTWLRGLARSQVVLHSKDAKNLDASSSVQSTPTYSYPREKRNKKIDIEERQAPKHNFVLQVPPPPDNPDADLPPELRPTPEPINENSPAYKKLLAEMETAKAKEAEEIDKKKQKELELQEKKRAAIRKTIDDYTTLSTAAVNAFQTINDAQIKALDAEIDIRKQRVEAATKLAERGNTDALRIEQERLDQVMKKREEYSRRQQVLNSALAVSNAVLAVAQAAGETGPAAIAVVPAVIAAIVAGYAAISAATKESTAQAFADGVVNFRGKGGPRDDANWVRISSGESVITAEGTQRNRHLLEAINRGVGFKLVDPMISNMLPLLQQPTLTGMAGSYASKKEMKSLEGKLDEVVYAIEGNKLRQNIFFNEQGVGIMTEKAVNRNRKRWS